jgi:beta-propeller repeat-containing protein/List-Bact-rpt repeat protein
MIPKQPTSRLGVRVFCSLSLFVLLAAWVLQIPRAQSAAKVTANSSTTSSTLPFVGGKSTPRVAHNASASTQPSKGMAFGNIPLAFEPNYGQAGNAQVKYMARAHGYSLFLTSSEAAFVMPVGPQNSPLLSVHKGMSLSELEKAMNAPQTNSAVAVLRMEMLGASAQPQLTAENLQPGKTNYLIGKDPKNWHSNIPRYGQVRYRDVYPGIDLAYHGTQQLEFDFVVKPGANPDKIALGFEGAQKLRTDNSGNLVLGTPAGEMQLLRPVAYQEKDGVRKPVSARFVTKEKNKVAFELGAYDRTRQLVIDPSITFATYYGGPQEETAAGVALDASGNIYLVGTTSSTTLPGPNPSNIGNVGTSHDGYIAQFTPSGTVGFLTFYGGSLDDFPQAVAVDATGIYIAGTTQSKDFPVSTGAAQTVYGGNGAPGTGHGAGDGFVLKLTPDGSNETWGTYAGGNDLDIAFALAVDSSQNVYVVGETFSTGPGLGTAFTPHNSLPQGNAENGSGDGFVVEVKADGSQFIIMSYIGGTNLDFATGVSWNAINGGTVYITGDTQSPNLPVTAGAFQLQCGTDGTCNEQPGAIFLDDAFVAAFNPANPTSYHYFTYLGGESVDIGFAIATDVSGNAYLTGETQSYSYPVTTSPAAYQSQLGSGSSNKGMQNAFATVLNPGGTALVYSTYLGGTTNGQTNNNKPEPGLDKGLGIALDTSKNMYITGQTTSIDFPLADPTQQAFGGGNTGQFDSDAFFTELDALGDPPVLSTYIGGSGDEDFLNGFIAVDTQNSTTLGNVYVVGDTNSLNLPVQVSSGPGGSGALVDSSLNGGQGVNEQCTVLNEITQLPMQVTCPDAFIYQFNPNTSGLLVTVAGLGTGTVTSAPNGITCPGVGTCGASFTTGTQVTLTPTPTPGSGSTFGGWGGLNSPCTGTGACAPVLNSNQFVTATFLPPATPIFTVALAGSGTGKVTSSPRGISCPGTCSAGFTSNQEPVTLTAAAGAGSVFAGWSGVCSGTSTCQQSLVLNETVTATFNLTPDFTLSGTALTPPSVTPGGSATSTLTVKSIGSFNSSVTFACDITPVVTPAPTCTAAAVTPAAGGQATTTLTVSTTGTSAALQSPFVHHARPLYALLLPIGGVMFFGAGFGSALSRKKKLLAVLMVCLVVSGLVFLAACGNNGRSAAGGGTGGTPAGTYTVQVTGTSGNLQVLAGPLTLTVQ